MNEAEKSGGGKAAPAAHTRRRVLRAAFTAAVAVTGTTAVLYPIVTSGEPEGEKSAAGRSASGNDPAGPAPEPAGGGFDEVYRGRRIQGVPTGTADGSETDGSPVVILIDGRMLHVMRRADGTYVSVANHYQPYATPLDTARGAVDVIGAAKLSLAGNSYQH
ncbi:tyrosinase family oxidase copper chaperone [Streptomyces sp. H39-S7]|uniref:tyrosinase family oxidase copper chaperone n=1 Tax=Streptomyces sp. H39-S7 TaxID=3004357 RepID=UPI0022AFA910|nr:tyrosinase family oxidase copper chaperone [Streptomyces sp. H39-S7]MCZ4117963.1 tyrosinase family oxidase copper chaperone [Streptomyces sp. H39-S7]